jgi:peptidoglycan/LPS O-acetylase OafA/YrhL
MTPGELQSKLIGILRFPLMVAVLLTHIHFPYAGWEGSSAWFLYIALNRIVGCVGVPLFFFISGYLFFHKTTAATGFPVSLWLEKIRKRARTLALPYFLWMTAWLLFYYALYHSPAARFLDKGVPYDTTYVLRAYWDVQFQLGDFAAFPLLRQFHDWLGWQWTSATFPVLGQFWFIRDLFLLVLVSPLIYRALCGFKAGWVLALGALWLFDVRYLPAWGNVSLFFFSFGAYFAIRGKLFTEEFSRLGKLSLVAYPLLALTELLTRTQFYCDILHRVTLLAGILFVVNLTAALLKTGKIKPNAFLSSASFFFFAIHQPWLTLPLGRLFFKNPPPATALMSCVYFLSEAAAIVALSLGLYYLFNRAFPRTTRLLTGGR